MKLNRKSLLMLALLVSCVSSHYGCWVPMATHSEPSKQYHLYYWDVGLHSGDTIKAAKLVRLTGGFLDLSVGRGEARSIALDSIAGLRQNMSLPAKSYTLPIVGMAAGVLLGLAIIEGSNEKRPAVKFSSELMGAAIIGAAVLGGVIWIIIEATSSDSPPEVYDLREKSHNEKYYIISQILGS
jgi:hypothetical protein